MATTTPLDNAVNERAAVMARLQTVSVGTARELLQAGQHAISSAQEGAKQPWYRPNLPGATSRADVAAHLQWHQEELSKETDENSIYLSGDDLKKWLLQAFSEWDAVDEGNHHKLPAISNKPGKDSLQQYQINVDESAHPDSVTTSKKNFPWWQVGVGVGVLAVGLGLYTLKKKKA